MIIEIPYTSTQAKEVYKEEIMFQRQGTLFYSMQ
jgi:hypothetical protein